MILTVKHLLNVFQFFNTICKELTLYNCAKFKWIHNQQLISCDNFQCEDSRMQIYGKYLTPPNDSKKILFYSTLLISHSEDKLPLSGGIADITFLQLIFSPPAL